MYFSWQPQSKPLFNTCGTIVSSNNVTLVENREYKLRFTDQSSELISSVMPLLNGCRTLAEVSEMTHYSIESIGAHLEQLEEDALVVDWEGHAQKHDQKSYVHLIRSFSRFYNQQIFSRSPAAQIFSGKANSFTAIGWGIEFYFFVRAANDYMPRALQSLQGNIKEIEPILQHYIDEALHEEIFLEGLEKCGFDRDRLSKRLPLASTLALINHLFETAGRGTNQYCSLFAVMQPKLKPDSKEEIATRYQRLKVSYPAASYIFESFEKHDCIDANLEHSELLLEQISKLRGLPSSQDIFDSMVTIQRTAFNFMLFYKGISDSYVNEAGLNALRNANSYGLVAN